MSRKDFRLIAEVIADLPFEEGDRELVALRFAERLGKASESFRSDKFLAACNVSVVE